MNELLVVLGQLSAYLVQVKTSHIPNVDHFTSIPIIHAEFPSQ